MRTERERHDILSKDIAERYTCTQHLTDGALGAMDLSSRYLTVRICFTEHEARTNKDLGRGLELNPIMKTDHAQVSIFASELIDDPYPVYASIQESNPVYFDAAFQTWVVTRFADCQIILKNHSTFSSRRPISSSPTTPGYDFILFSNDPPIHTELRSCVQRIFTSANLRALTPWIETTIERMLRDLDGEIIDFAAELAIPLPIRVIAKILGIEIENYNKLKLWTERAVGHHDSNGTHNGRKSLLEMHGYFRNLIRQKRLKPDDSLLGQLLSLSESKSLTELELINFCVTLLIAGNETTASLIGNSLYLLSSRPDLWESMKSDSSVIDKVIEESLRFESPVQFVNRKVATSWDLGTAKIRTGEIVTLAIGAANRDPCVFKNPGQFEPLRTENSHLAFSHGIHYCLGASLSRLEARLTLTALLRRFASVSRLHAAKRFRNVFFRGFCNLAVEVGR